MTAQVPASSPRERPGLAGRFLSFTLVGGAATALQYAILVAAVELLGWPAALASSVGFCVSAVVNYWLNYHVTFGGRARHSQAAGRFALVALTGLLVNGGAMLALERVLGLHYLLAQVLATGLTLSWSFAASHLWAFRAPLHDGSR